MRLIKTCYAKIVTSSAYPWLLSIRGPKGADDGIRHHLTESGFSDGDNVVIVSKADYHLLLGAYEAYNAKGGGK